MKTITKTTVEKGTITHPVRTVSLSTKILIGLLLGIAAGIMFGEYCGFLSVIGDAFVGLLRMTVLPYIVLSLIANLGKLSLKQSSRLAVIGGTVLLLLWSVALFTVFALAQTFPEWKGGSFFSTSTTEVTQDLNLIDVFIPANFFEALSENHVPAVVLLSIAAGLGLSTIPNRETLVTHLDILAKVMIRISTFVTRLAPLGVFAISASTAGTLALDEISRLQVYLVAYTSGAVFLGTIVLPLLVTCCTPFSYRDVFVVARDAMLTALATGKLIVVLPILIEHSERLFEKHEFGQASDTAPAVDILYPIAYPFPHIGKLLSLLFLPFSAWFLGSALQLEDYALFLPAGLFSYFGGPILAMPFLLDLMHLPHDMFQLFILLGVYEGRLGDALGAMHLTGFTLISTCAFLGRLQLRVASIVKYLVTTTIVGCSIVIGLRMTLGSLLDFTPRREALIASMQLLDHPIKSVVIEQPVPNPDPLLPGESLMDRIRRRGIIRVGFNEDKLPFAYFNGSHNLVGFDIDMVHALARDLGVTIEFVRFDRKTLGKQLAADHFDVVMSGLVGTLDRAEEMQHTTPYMEVTLALVVPDFRARNFRAIAALRNMRDLKIGYVDLSSGFVDRLRDKLPEAVIVELASNKQFFQTDWKELDALLISAESGSAFSLLNPDFEVVVPRDLEVKLPLFYAIGNRDFAMRDFLEHWITLRRHDGTMDDFYDHWILGKTATESEPRWSVIRDVLGWVE